MTVPPLLPSDRQLVDAARAGHEAAWAELLSRHEPAIRAVLPGRSRAAKRAVTRSLESLRGELSNTAALGEEAVRAFRPRAIAHFTGGRYGPVPLGDDETNRRPVTDDQLLLASAFARLPEPWQTALWHTHVEQLSAAEVSPLVGRSTSEVGELVATAERGLADAFLQEYAERISADDATATVVSLLSGYVRSSLPPSEERVIDDHLDEDTVLPSGHSSHDSRRLISVLSALPTTLPGAVAPGVTGLTVQQLRRAVGTATRSFGAETLVQAQSDRVRRTVLIGSAAAVALVLVGAALWLGQPGSSSDPSEPTSRPSGTGSPGSVGTDATTDVPTSPSTTVDEAAQTSTTELELRPSGPPNEIDLVVNAGTRAEPVGALESRLATRVGAPAPVFAGGSGTLDVSLTNDSGEPVVANVELTLPKGVVFAELADGAAACSDPEDDSPSCDIVVDANSTLDLSLRLRLESTVVGRIVVDGASVVEPLDQQIVAVSDLVHNSVGSGEILVVGNTLMGCADEAEAGVSCADVQAGSGPIVDRWDVPMKFVNVAPGFGFSNSSTATLEIPAGATVRAAYLFWAGDVEVGDQAVSPDGQSSATLITPAGEFVEVRSDHIAKGEEDASQYLSRVDVTPILAAAGSGEYLLGNITSVEAPGSLGAWSLVVVTDDDALPRREFVVLDPFAWVAPTPLFEYGLDLPTPALSGSPARIAVFGLEGERGRGGEVLAVSDASIAGDNPFNSTIGGPRNPTFDNNLGVDIDAYDLVIDTPAGILTIDATSGADGVRVAVLGIAVDIAS